uniref:Putative site specific recombinase n=1 Tax=Rheinheimera sp. BAL341 TaxID=1708203 RepID=A0A486XPN9_9GAMM
MTYSARLIRVEAHGDREVLVTDQDGMPPIEINMYLAGFRAKSHSYRLSIARAIVKIHMWAESLNINLLERIKSGEFLYFQEIESFREYLRYRINAPTHAPQTIEIAQTCFICADTYKTRARLIGKYLNYLGDVWAGTRKRSDPYSVELNNFIASFRQLIVEREGVTYTKQRYGLSEEVVEKLLWWIKPENPLNPFQKRVQLRNQLVVSILLFTGAREGELLSMRPDALVKKTYGYALRITQNTTLDQDPRANPPNVKTYGRDIPVDDYIAQLTDVYIQSERKQRGRIVAKAPPYLFLNSNLVPKPMSYRCVYHICERLREVDPEHLSTLHPYQFRHTFNDLLVLNSELDPNSEEFKNTQRNLCGWSENSEQGINYTKRSREILAARILKKMTSRFNV